MTKYKARIKSLLYYYGVSYPEVFKTSGTHWSKRFLKWLSEGVIFEHESSRLSLKILVKEAEQQRALLLEITKSIRLLSQSENYTNNMKLLQSIPGIGFITAITFLTEIEKIERFMDSDHFAGFVGLIPNRHSSGGKENTGEMTFRGQNNLRMPLIESSWIAARFDPALTICYHRYVNRMEPNKAIIKIARKLLNRIYFVLKHKKEYVSCVVK